MAGFIIEVHKDLEVLRLYSYEDDEERYVLEKEWPVATGMEGHPTPVGRFEVRRRQRCPKWVVPSNINWMPREQWGNIYDCESDLNPIKGRWIGFYKDIGIHGTDNVESLGHPASHGCVRMAVPAVKELFPLARKGTPVIIKS